MEEMKYAEWKIARFFTAYLTAKLLRFNMNDNSVSFI